MSRLTPRVLLLAAALPAAAGAQTYTYTGSLSGMVASTAGSASTVTFAVTGGYFGSSGARSQTFTNANIVINSLTMDNGWSEAVTTFSAATSFTGSGTISTASRGLGQDFVFIGDMTGYSGAINMSNATGGFSTTLGNSSTNIVQFGGTTAGGTTALGTVSTDALGLRVIDNVAGTGTCSLNNLVLNYAASAGYDYLSVTNAIATRYGVTVTGTADLRLTGVLSGAGVLRQLNTGTTTLSGNNTFTGGGLVRMGTVVAAHSNALGTSGSYTLGDASSGSNSIALLVDSSADTVTLARAITVANLGTGTVTLGSLATSGSNFSTFSGAVTLNRATTLTGGTSATGDRTEFRGGISGSGDITIAGTRRVIFVGTAHTHTGQVALDDNAILQLSDGSSTTASFLNDDAVVTLGSGSDLRLAKGEGNSETIAALAGSGSVTALSAANTLILAGSGTSTHSGVLRDNGGTLSLVKSGSGTQTLAGASTYAGSTSVTGGVLLVEGSLASSGSVSVSSGATLGGSGSVGDVTLAAGGRLAATGIGFTLASLTAGSGAGDTATLAFGIDAGLPGEALITSSYLIQGALTANGGDASLELDFGASLANLANGTYDLLTYGGSALADSVFSVTGTQGARQQLTLSQASNVVSLGVSSASAVWTGSGNDWSAASGNWRLTNQAEGQSTAFVANDAVIFSDAASSGSVLLTADVAPAAIAVTADTLDYNISASGAFGVTSGALVKTGAAQLTIANANAFSSVTLSAGRTRVGSDGALGSGALVLGDGVALSSDGVAARSLANDVTLQGNATLGDAVDTGALTLSGTLSLNTSDSTLTLASDVAVSGVVTGSGLVKAGSASLTLASANALSGSILVNEGALILSHATAALPSTSNVVVDGATSELALDGSSQTLSSLAVRGDGRVSGSAALTLTGALELASGSLTLPSVAAASYDVRSGSVSSLFSGAVSLTKSTSGTVTLSGNSTYSGATTVSAGILEIGDGGSTGNIGSGAVTLASGTVLRFNRTGFLDYKNAARLRTLSGAGSLVIDGGVKIWNYTGSGTGFDEANSWAAFSGGITLLGGSELQTIRNGRTALGSGAITLGDASTSGILSQVEGNWTWTNAISVVGSDNVIRNNSSGADRSLKLNGVLSGEGGLTLQDATGAMGNIDRGFILTASNTFSGTLTLDAHVRVGGVSGDSISLDPDAAGTLGSAVVSIVSGKRLSFTRTDTHVVTNDISGQGGINIGSSGFALTATQDVTLAGDNSYSGGTELLQGTLRVAQLSALGSGYLAVKNGSTFVYTGSGSESTTRNLFLDNGSATLEVSNALATLTWNDAATKSQALTKSGAGTLVLGGELSGSGTLTVTDGLLVLNAASSGRSGAVEVQGGTLRIGDVAALGTGNVTVSGGVLDLANLAPTNLITLSGGSLLNASAWAALSAVELSGTLDSSVINNLGDDITEVKVGAGATVDLAGVTKDIVFEGGNLANVGAYNGRIKVKGSLDVSGGTHAGELEVASGGTLDFGNAASSRAVKFTGGAITGANFTGNVEVVGSNVSLTSDLAAGKVRLTAGNSASIQAGFNRAITFEGGELSGLENYSGELTLDGSSTLSTTGVTTDATIAVASGSTLKGSGTVGAIIQSAGSILAPGNSPGLLTTDTAVLAGGAEMQVEFISATGTRGDAYDAVAVTGDLDLSGLTDSSRYTLRLISLSALPSTQGALAEFDGSTAYIYDLFTYASLTLPASFTGNIADLFTIDTTSFQDASGEAVTGSFTLFNNVATNTLELQYAPIPEPSTYGMMLGGLALAAAALRRRRKF